MRLSRGSRRTMKRRTALLWTGAIAGSGATVFGTGAFDSVEADRDLSVSVVGDASAYLSLSSGSGDVGGFVTQPANGVVSIDVGTVDNGTTTPGDGVNEGTVSAFDDLLRVENQGTGAVAVSASFPATGGVVLFTAYGGPGSVAALDEAGNAVTLGVGASTEVGLAIDAGHGTPEIPGTFADGDVVEVTIVASET